VSLKATREYHHHHLHHHQVRPVHRCFQEAPLVAVVAAEGVEEVEAVVLHQVAVDFQESCSCS
jgi:hypothetical protein